MTTQEIFETATAPEGASVSMPAAMLVFAHPDDEVIALGARLGRFQSAYIVHVTDGAPRNEQDSHAHGFASLEEYRRARGNELRRALKTAGLHDSRSECLDIPDQEASLQLLQLTRRLSELIGRWRPDVIFTHPYEGGHPDHDACAFAVHHAVALLREKGQLPPPIVEAAFYHAGQNGIETGIFLPSTKAPCDLVYRLSPEERRRKQALLECFATQKDTLRYFKVKKESFRIAPNYDFRKPPHAGQVFYDRYPWGMTSQRFCQLATEADNEMREEAVVTCR